MSNDYDNTNRGGLFKNNRRRDGKNDPQLQGSLDVNGVEYYISGWTKNNNGEKYVDKNGNAFISLSIRKREPREGEILDNRDEDLVDMDDEIPF